MQRPKRAETLRLAGIHQSSCNGLWARTYLPDHLVVLEHPPGYINAVIVPVGPGHVLVDICVHASNAWRCHRADWAVEARNRCSSRAADDVRDSECVAERMNRGRVQFCQSERIDCVCAGGGCGKMMLRSLVGRCCGLMILILLLRLVAVTDTDETFDSTTPGLCFREISRDTHSLNLHARLLNLTRLVAVPKYASAVICTNMNVPVCHISAQHWTRRRKKKACLARPCSTT